MVNRRVTGAFFVAFEGLAITMALKSKHQLGHLRKVESEDDPESQERVVSKEQEVQDWAVLIGFNHLMAAAEAYVATLLWDFPGDLEATRLPDGRLGIGVRVGLP